MIQGVITGPLLVPLISLLAIYYTGSAWPAFVKKFGSNATKVGTVSATAILFQVLSQMPSRAQFLNNANDFFTQSFPGSDDVVEIVINLLRALFIIYFIVGLVQVLNAVRQDEDYKQAAKIPFMVFVVVAIADVGIGVLSGA